MAKNVPEHLRRAVRLAICTGIACSVGFSLLKPLGGWHSRWGSQTMMGTKWAAITCVVINHPVISKSGEAAVERVLGTVTGGVLGYVLSIFNDAQPFYEEPFITVFAVAGVGFASVLLGNRLQLDYAGRLFIMTFILVAMAAPTKADAFIVAVTRISGIVFGVIISTFMSVLVFPKSASHQATDNLKAGLSALAELNSIAWKKHGCGEDNVMEPLKYEEPHRLTVDGGDYDSYHLLVEPEDRSIHFDKTLDTCCDKMLSEVYRRMSKSQEFTAMSKSETYIFTARGRWCFFPGFKCFPWRSALPTKEMQQVTESARKVARLLWCLHASLPDEADIRALGHYWGAHEFLASLGSSLQVYLENVASCFPGLHKLECSPMYTFIEGVETLISASHRMTQGSTILLQAPYNRRSLPASMKDDDDEEQVRSALDMLDLCGPPGKRISHGSCPSNGDLRPPEGRNREIPASAFANGDSEGFDGRDSGDEPGRRGWEDSSSLDDSASGRQGRIGRHSIADTLGLAKSVPLDTLSSHNVAFILARDSVMRVGGPKTSNLEASHQEGAENVNSPVTEVLSEEATTKAVRKAAAGADRTLQRAPSQRPQTSKEVYYSQVQWQATQFLLQRLTKEVAYLNVSFINLSVRLPPTRWESRRKSKQAAPQNADLEEPLLRE